MRLTVNGKARAVEGLSTILEFLEAHQLNPALVAVEHNGEIVRREGFSQVRLEEGDHLEIIHMVGGGAHLTSFEFRVPSFESRVPSWGSGR